MTRKLMTLTMVASLLVGLSLAASAAPLLSVDIGPDGSPVKPGFTALTQTNVIVTMGAYNVAVGGAISAPFDATTPVGQAMLQDFTYSITASTNFGVWVDGLAPNTPYLVTLWSYQDLVDTETTIAPYPDQGTTGAPISIIHNGNTLFTDESPEVQATGTFTTNGDGLLYLLVNGWSYSPAPQGIRLNGFTVSAVPEPGSASLAAMGLAATLVVRRRRLAAQAAA